MRVVIVFLVLKPSALHVLIIVVKLNLGQTNFVLLAKGQGLLQLRKKSNGIVVQKEV